MSTIAEVESAIEQLRAPQVKELAVWLESHVARPAQSAAVLAATTWLERARGAARPDVTTAEVKALTNAMSEGFNSKIQQLRHTARGFRNFDNFRNRILFFCGKLQLLPKGVAH
jgi:transposase